MKMSSLWILTGIVACAWTGSTLAEDWMQDAHDAQRSGYITESPTQTWTFLWGWNGPNSTPGTADRHIYDAPREARTVTGGSYIYAPAGSHGIYALNKRTGAQGWNFTAATINATPAYDDATRCLFAGGADGKLYKINAITGAVLGNYNAGGPINKSIMLVGPYAYVITDNGQLMKIDTIGMTRQWVYSAGSGVATPPAYSRTKDVVVFVTDDLNVHAVNNSTGLQKWKVKPTPSTPGYPQEFEFGWPVVAEQAGLVMVRMTHDGNQIWGPGTKGRYPNTNAEIRSYLIANPQWQNLYALDLATGSKRFIPAVGPGSTEDYINGGPMPRVGTMPVVKTLSNGKEVVYITWRNGQVADANWDGRWDSHMGEMVLDDNTVPGYLAGDVRFVDSRWDRITDEQCPLTVAGNTLLYSHWDYLFCSTMTNRADNLGGTRTTPIKSTYNPTLVRSFRSSGTPNTTTHWTTAGLQSVDGRYIDGPGWWAYWNILSPPGSGTPAPNTYSDGIRPRYAYVADGLVVAEGNGGDLMVFSHKGTVWNPTYLPGDANRDGVVDVGDLGILGAYYGSQGPVNWWRADFNNDGKVDVGDLGMLGANYGKTSQISPLP